MPATTIALPSPRTAGTVSLDETLRRRYSLREFRKAPITLAELSQLLWAAQGVSHDDGLRTAPSGGALYPLELYVVAGNVGDLAAGVYRYLPRQHHLEAILRGDLRADLAAAALEQDWLTDSAAVLVLAAVEERATGKYGARGVRYIHLEAGHAAQNALLQAVALGFGGTPVGAFDDGLTAQLLHLPEGQQPLYLLPFGAPR